MTSLPYTRFHLGHRPAASQDSPLSNVPLEVWTNFWARIDQPIARLLWRDNVASYVHTAIRIGVMILFFHIFFQMQEPRPSFPVILFLAFFVVFYVHTLIQNYFKQSNFEKIKSIIAEESPHFESFGFFLECRDEIPRDYGRKPGYYLYFLPCTYQNEDNGGFIRVEVAKDTVCGWNFTPSLAYYDYVPNGMESISVSDWADFWSKVDAASQECVSAQRRLNAIILLDLILIYVPLLFPENSIIVWVAFGFMWPIVFYGFYCLGRVTSFDSTLDSIITQYTDRFKQQSVHVEYRKEKGPFENCRGKVRRFIYMFRLLERPTALDA